jgi:hypothetical protein
MVITLDKIREIYPNSKIIAVEEYFSPAIGKWTSILSDGMDVRDPDLYYQYGLHFVVGQCIKDGANIIQFKLIDETKEYCYPDFRVTELT